MIDICYKTIPCCGCPYCDTCNKEKSDKLFNDFFSKYGSHSKYAEKTLHVFQIHPDELKNIDNILHAFERADKDISRLEELIAALKIYKMRLTDRYNYIKTVPTKKKIKLERNRVYKGNVFYNIIFYSVNLDDGTETETERQTFKGTEKRQAMAKFEELKKQYRQAIFEIDIAKKYWEK